MLNDRLADRAWVMGDEDSIADMSLLGWIRNLIGFYDAAEIVDAVTNYIARRLIECEQVLDSAPQVERRSQPLLVRKPGRHRIWIFLAGGIVGGAALFGLALLASLRGI